MVHLLSIGRFSKSLYAHLTASCRRWRRKRRRRCRDSPRRDAYGHRGAERAHVATNVRLGRFLGQKVDGSRAGVGFVLHIGDLGGRERRPKVRLGGAIGGSVPLAEEIGSAIG